MRNSDIDIIDLRQDMAGYIVDIETVLEYDNIEGEFDHTERQGDTADFVSYKSAFEFFSTNIMRLDCMILMADDGYHPGLKHFSAQARLIGYTNDIDGDQEILATYNCGFVRDESEDLSLEEEEVSQ